ncbi:MAG: hypothetical protein KBD06_02345 [Candidatus Pacebacteria bacterium]|nr:hypothetical protein [Candidatus Paceibacterota bacterium]
MLHLYFGNDSDKARAKLNAAVEKGGKNADVFRITDAHTLADLEAALMGGGMFGGPRVVVLDSTLTHDEMRGIVLDRLATLKAASDTFYIYETALDAATRKLVEKYAETTEKFELIKTKDRDTIFGLVRPLQDGKKKDLWVAYQREIIAGNKPEAIHGMMFYAAKDALLRKPSDMRARKLVAELAELPHEARRQGFELEYALERFVLSSV